MADNNEPTLRNALDAVNASRKWTLLGIGAMFFSVALLLFMLFMMVIPSLQPPGRRRGAGGDGRYADRRPKRRHQQTDAAEGPLGLVGDPAVVRRVRDDRSVMLHVSRMTRAVLRAIESTRK